jgi:hypothetical protein
VPGLPYGIFSNQKSYVGYILKGIGMENVGIFLGQFEYFKNIWCIL